MTQHEPGSDLPSDQEVLRGLIEVAGAIFDAVPLAVWGIVAVLAVKVLNDQRSDRSESAGDGYSEDSLSSEGYEEPARERYSIHDDIETGDREYERPSESDELVNPHEVDRSLVGTMKQLIGMVFRSGGDSERS